MPIEIVEYYQRPGGWNWADFYMCDIVFLQRPGKPEHLQLAEFCKKVGLKIWIDYDDNFYHLPPENRMYDSVTVETKKCMTQLIRMADVVTVSTEELKRQMDALGCKYCEVVPNALNTDIIKPVTKYNTRKAPLPPLNQKQAYVWRGSDTHWMDVFDHIQPMMEAMEMTKEEVEWYFFGWRPSYFDRFNLPYTYVAPTDIILYYQQLRSLRPEFMHVVLSPNQFNLNKSNIAWIEATAAGAICVAPDWPEWKRPGILNYSSLEGYRDLLVKRDWSEGELESMWQASMDYIQENLILSKVNRQRVNLIQKIMDNYDFKVQLPIPSTMIE